MKKSKQWSLGTVSKIFNFPPMNSHHVNELMPTMIIVSDTLHPTLVESKIII